jgi:hypothetical protein
MAAMDYATAQALARKKIQAGQAKGMPLEEITRQIITESRAVGGIPQTAIANVLAAPPVVLTPATKAVQGVPFVAEKPVASAQPQAEAMPAQEAAPRPAAPAPRPSRYRPMLEAAKAQLVEMQTSMSGAAANKQKISEIDRVKFDTQKDVVRELEQRALAEEGAAAPEEMLAALAKREERLGRREELLQESKSRSPWEALLAGGAAMAQGRRGENFGEALSRGLQAGLTDYGRSRRENIAGVEALGEARDETALKRYELGEKAREGASNLIDTQSAMQQRAITLRNNLLKSGVDAATADATVKTAIANAEKATFEAESAPTRLAMERDLNAARIEEAKRRDKPEVDVEKRAYETNLEKLVEDYAAADAEYIDALKSEGGKKENISSEITSKRNASRARAVQASSALFKRYGSTPYPFQGEAIGKRAAVKAPPVPGARLADDGKYYVPDPKRPGKYFEVG